MLFVTIFVTVVAVAVPHVAGQLPCPPDWVAFQGSCYVFVNDVATWTGAQTICSLMHSRLVEITSSAENNFIAGQMKVKNVSKSWIGLNDFTREGRFVWSSTLEVAEYTNWAPGEPNDTARGSQGDQDCGVIYSSGLWDDDFCESTHHHQFFCERAPTEDGSILG